MNLYINGYMIEPGEKVRSFRGEIWTYLSITREPEPGKSGKILARRGKWEQELYPTVFNGEIR